MKLSLRKSINPVNNFRLNDQQFTKNHYLNFLYLSI
ncbi:hypothetical protein CoNPh17_CDS0143 [Staphylococcus phage S-CoN_Ph17]|nr:hypothetical protein CoNPh17_CDS0143 [Staphylococcus phage S-CoN_Ph17]